MRRSAILSTVASALTLAAFTLPTTGSLATPKPNTAVRRVMVTPDVHRDVSPPLRDIPPSHTPGRAYPALRAPIERPRPVVHARDTSGTRPGRRLIPSPIANFDGISANGSIPPDTQGAPGSNNQYVEMANHELAVYDKTGTLLMGPEATNTLWSGFGGGCETNNDGDGIVLFDTLSLRWVLSQFSVGSGPPFQPPYLECVAVSRTTDATGGYNRYSFSTPHFPDYPKMGVWPDAYYTTFNLFSDDTKTELGTETCAYDRFRMLNGQPATQQCFMAYLSTQQQTLLPASLEGFRLPSAGEPNFEVSLSNDPNALSYFTFHVDWTIPSNSMLTGPTDLAVTAFSLACGGGACIPQSGTQQQLDSLGDRLMARLAYRNLGDHESLVVTHSIVAGSSVGTRWYELRVGVDNSLSIFQQGTYAPDSAYRWMGSIATDQSGDIALGYSVSSGSLHPEIRYTGRLPGDPAGQMPQGEATVIAGGGSQTPITCNGNPCGQRWGDYSAMSVDPSDDCTFWYASEYIPTTSPGQINWQTRIASLSFPSCGAPLWLARYGGKGGDNSASSLAVSPTGNTLFVTGSSAASNGFDDYATVAYNASTGAKLWVARYNGPANGEDQATSLGVSPDGTKVLVTGFSSGAGSAFDYATVAYNASTGAKLWVARYNGPGNSYDYAYSLRVSPDGTKVFVTGGSDGSGSGSDYATVAYDASTGAKLWVARYNGHANGNDAAYSLGVSPDGKRVFVTGESFGSGSFFDYATVAYKASTGAKVWVARYNGPQSVLDSAASLGVSPDGTRVFVTGTSFGSGSDYDYATVAYDASTGSKLWVARYNGPGNGEDEAVSLGVSPDGSSVFVTGFSFGVGSGYDYATAAYSASTGSKLWVARYEGPGKRDDFATSLGVSPDGSSVFVTGYDSDYATVGYTSTGIELWVALYNGPANGNDQGMSLGVSTDGARVFVTGTSNGSKGHLEYATVAYHAS